MAINNFRRIQLIKFLLLGLLGTICTRKENNPLTIAAKEFIYVLENRNKYNAELAELMHKEAESFEPGKGFTPSTPPAWEHQLFFKAISFVDHYQNYGDLQKPLYKRARKEFDLYASFNSKNLPDGRDCKALAFPNDSRLRTLDVKTAKSCEELSAEKEKLWIHAVDSYRILAYEVIYARP